VANPQFVNLKLATALPSLFSTALPTSSLASASYAAPSAPAGVPADAAGPQAEWAAEAILNLRHVVAGTSCALIIEAAVALSIYATWNLWHLR
jgi:hypothetical protein